MWQLILIQGRQQLLLALWSELQNCSIGNAHDTHTGPAALMLSAICSVHWNTGRARPGTAQHRHSRIIADPLGADTAAHVWLLPCGYISDSVLPIRSPMAYVRTLSVHVYKAAL